jgi:hypothetical protein
MEIGMVESFPSSVTRKRQLMHGPCKKLELCVGQPEAKWKATACTEEDEWRMEAHA